MKIARLLSALCVALLFNAVPASAETAWPNKPIRIIYPFPPGGSDSVVRLYGDRLSQLLKTPVIIENRGGAGGNIGAESAARSAADGYTLLIGTNGPLAINPLIYPGMRFNPERDFAPITGLVSAPQVMFIRPGLPVHDVAGLVAYSKAHPAELSYGSVGKGSVSHLTMELFKSLTGANIMHVPYQGAGPAISDVLGGQISMMTVAAGSAMPHVKSGMVRALAITGAKRSTLAPGVPTLAELGIPLQADAWLVLVAPAGTPAEVIARLNQATKTVVQDPGFVEKVNAVGYEPAYTTPAGLAAMLAHERDMWAGVVKSANLAAE